MRSARPSGKPTNRSGEALEPPRDAGRGSHGSQGAMVHAHLSMPMAYGAPTILMWVVAFYLAGALDDSWLRRLRYAIVVYAIGFYLQILLSLGPLMLKQFDLVTTSGYWALKGLETPWGGPAIWSLPDVERLVWLRLPGDIVAGASIAVFLVVIWARLLRALRG